MALARGETPASLGAMGPGHKQKDADTGGLVLTSESGDERAPR